jgi:N-acyl-D-aspartate/D-glutamate deacylase
MTTERLLLVGGLVVDGTGRKPPERADVLLSDGRVEAFLSPASCPADGPVGLESARSLDCAGALVTPGFIDIHTHSDLTWLTTPDCSSRVTQAITTEVVGNCGMSPAPRSRHDPSFRQTISVIDQDPGTPLGFESFEEYLGHLTAHRAAVNVAPLVGHGSARQTAMFYEGDGATGPGVAELIRQALGAGAWGSSLGLMYPPGEAAGADELAAVASVTAAAGAMLAVHMRDYGGAKLAGSVAEMCSLQEQTGLSLELSHLRAVRADSLSVIARCLEQLEQAGPRVHADAYPYTAGQTTLFQLLEPVDRQLGVASFLASVAQDRAHYADSIEASGFEPGEILVVRAKCAQDRAAVGRTLAEVAEDEGKRWPAVAVDLLERSDCYVDVVVFGSQIEEQESILAHDKVTVGSDGFSVSSTYPSVIHPRAYGAFPKALRLLVDGGMPWERAIAKVTGLPAAKVGLEGRGVLKPQAHADVAVIEPDNLADRATYESPLLPSSGIRHVLVAGVPVLLGGRPTGAYPGRALLRR